MKEKTHTHVYDDDAPRHFEYEMMMTPEHQMSLKKNDGVMTIWPLPLMTPPLACEAL